MKFWTRAVISTTSCVGMVPGGRGNGYEEALVFRRDVKAEE